MTHAAALPHPAVPLAVLDDPVELARFTRMRPSAEGAVAESSFQLGGMHCAACAGLIENALTGVDGVLAAEVNASAQRATVRWSPSRVRASQLVQAVQAAGYDAVPDTTAQARALRLAESRRLLWRLFVASFCAMQVMMMAAPAYVAGPGELAPDLGRLLEWASWLLTLPVLLFSAGPFFAGAWHALRRRRIGMDVPVAIGIAVCFVASSAAAFSPGGWFGSEVYFDSLGMFVSFLLLGRYLEMKARHRAAETLEQALGELPQTAQRLADDGSSHTVSVHRLVPLDRVRVAAGAAFPADGVLLDGATQADEALLSGESRPVAKAAGDTLIAGSVNLGAPVVMQVLQVGLDTRYEAIVALVRDALSQRPAVTRLADRCAGPFLWCVLLLAAVAVLAWQAIDPSRAVWVAVSVLIVTCPCALSLAAPSALLSATGALARRGVLLRRVDALEDLAQVSQVFIDKTGTLTDTRPAWRGARLVSGAPGQAPDALLQAAAGLARWSQHPLSQALAEAVPQADATPRWQTVQETSGAGLSAWDEQGCEWRLGSAAWLGQPHMAQAAGDHLQAFFGRPGRPLLCLEFDEAQRPDAAAAIQALRVDGVRVSLLSGDAPSRVSALAARLGIADAQGGCSPDAKLAAIRRAQADGTRVAMVGDGVNDAPVLAQADVSFAMAHGAFVARVHADAVILSNRLADFVHARRLARRTVRVMRQNLAWAAAYNLACVPLALAGALPPWAAGLGMALSSLLVVGNSLRLARAHS
ncbi:heavy metal translocating P-type ATPase [Ideonella sp. BN130291]|uniref:heavy metal translocating P-type ATPase n=1 Tax=Ideonella sp. BN130291 TaxID=3112940 RepID=UPI002E25AFFF|nr:cation-translocating P-type ATPase [Ideonella sp. BN130291]